MPNDSHQEPQLNDPFMQEPKSKDPTVMWIFILVFIFIITLLWGLGTWQEQLVLNKRKNDPFLNVTNRQFSLFLWQNPEFLRSHFMNRAGYLVAFKVDDEMHLIPELADEYVDAPIEVIFRYHIWDALIKKESLAFRPLIVKEFKQFLNDCPEWLPINWPYKDNLTVQKMYAPQEYCRFVETLTDLDPTENLSRLSEDIIPFDVRLAFQGWKNYFQEKENIEEQEIAVKKAKNFLKLHEKYERNYWQIILEDSYPNYLISLDQQPDREILRGNELPSFFKIAYYNFSKALNNQ